MATKRKYKLKQQKGVLHIGGGRFFYPGQPYELTAKELAGYGKYFEEDKNASSGQENTSEPGTNDEGK